jgi:hypothetical protein
MATIETYAKPTWLYRYRSLRQRGEEDNARADSARLAREIDALIEGYIHCSTYNQMNDPMEGFFRANPGGTGGDDEDDFFAAVRNEKMGLGIASLSETWDNELMWAHYAAGFRGICVTYPTARLLSGLDQHHALSRVAYSERPHYLGLKDLRNRDERARAVLSAKSLKWAYEREWRLFSPQPGRACHGSRGATTVYLGMRMAVEDRRTIRRQLKGTGIAVRRTLVDGYSLKCLAARRT